jgi:Mrp family chromosome partitioning ATPase
MRDLVNVWRKQFDLILLDGPPVLPVTDSIAVAGMADTTVLVARCGYTPRASLKRAYQMLEEQVADARVRVVLNGVNPGSYAFDSFYGRSLEKYYGGEKYASA